MVLPQIRPNAIRKFLGERKLYYVTNLADFNLILTGTAVAAVVATAGVAAFGTGSHRRPTGATGAKVHAIMPGDFEALPIEHDDPDYRECVAISQRIAKTMIADEWLEIADKMSTWESNLTSTPGGTRFHDIAARTCLSGLQGLIDDAPRNSPDDLADAEIEVSHFVDTHRQTPSNHILALLAARAHIAIGEAYSSGDWSKDMRRAAWRQSAQHFMAAEEILKPFDAIAQMSPLLAEAYYLQALGAPGGEGLLPTLFQDWIDLDPSNSSIYDTHVAAMVAYDLLTGDDVLREAEEALQRTEKTLGFGGYALFFAPLLVEYDSARDLLDPELYAAALMDLASRSATQAEVNNSAAALLTQIEAADEETAAAYRDTLIMMICRHLKVIYPRLWPISVEEIQEFAAEASFLTPHLDAMDESDFLSVRSRIAA